MLENNKYICTFICMYPIAARKQLTELNPDIERNDCKRPPEVVRQFWDDQSATLNHIHNI